MLLVVVVVVMVMIMMVAEVVGGEERRKRGSPFPNFMKRGLIRLGGIYSTIPSAISAVTVGSVGVSIASLASERKRAHLE